MPPSAKHASLGQVIEYIPDRLYLGAYIQPPGPETYFPFGYQVAAAAAAPRSPSRRTRQAAAEAKVPPTPRLPPVYFSVDDTLLYNAFHHDFGPLNVGHLYRFALEFHELLGAKENEDRPIVFWSRADSRSRANAACLLACYMILVQSWPPHLALAPVAQIDPPLMPFRDAGYSQADYGISVQDVVYGVWKAKEEGCCALDDFDLCEYERFERVEHGDFNWITPNFLAFASPQHEDGPGGGDSLAVPAPLLPRDLDAVEGHPTLSAPFKNVLRHFVERNVGLVVRLNSPLYPPSYFEALGIQHIDMIFDDGTCPTLSTVRRFIQLAHDTIVVKKKGVAVHCKAGLGRTGCLIGAYLIYRHGFTADEVIAFMRFMRPGMVVGPQQHWLHLNQGTFREWCVEERVERRLRREMAAAAAAGSTSGSTSAAPSTPIRVSHKGSLRNGQASTPTPRRNSSIRTPLSEVDQDRNNIGVQEDYLPAPTPGQPRKSHRADRHHHGHHQQRAQRAAAMEAAAQSEAAAAARPAARPAAGAAAAAHVEEEWTVRMSATSSSREPTATEGYHRSASHAVTSASASASASTVATATIASVYHRRQVIDNDASNDVENICPPQQRAKAAAVDRAGSASGVLAKVRSSKRHHPESSPLRAKDAGVRKTSGRIGSLGSGVPAGSTATASASATAASSVTRKVSVS